MLRLPAFDVLHLSKRSEQTQYPTDRVVHNGIHCLYLFQVVDIKRIVMTAGYKGKILTGVQYVGKLSAL